ncbi:hypothetical protein ACSSS7_000818 [Eimeria intestinalis]
MHAKPEARDSCLGGPADGFAAASAAAAAAAAALAALETAASSASTATTATTAAVERKPLHASSTDTSAAVGCQPHFLACPTRLSNKPHSPPASNSINGNTTSNTSNSNSRMLLSVSCLRLSFFRSGYGRASATSIRDKRFRVMFAGFECEVDGRFPHGRQQLIAPPEMV